jgi:hypothetical protein
LTNVLKPQISNKNLSGFFFDILLGTIFAKRHPLGGDYFDPHFSCNLILVTNQMPQADHVGVMSNVHDHVNSRWRLAQPERLFAKGKSLKPVGIVDMPQDKYKGLHGDLGWLKY